MAAAKVTRAKRMGGPYNGPYGPTPLTQVGYHESRHLHPERLSAKQKDKAVSVRLLDVSKDTILNMQDVSATVKRLVAANLQLKIIPEDLIAALLHLTKLDLSNNSLGDTSFPESMKKLEQLLEIRLGNNQLTKVPVCIRKLKNLTRLDMSDNRMESCNGLDKLRKLQILVLDNNKLTSLFKEIATLRRLEVLRCSRNNLREIPRDVRQLKTLVDLDVSDNRISILPTDIFLLPKLDVLNASQNEVSKVPTFNIRPQNKHWISNIDLSDNKLIKFPGHLLQMSSKLDLSGNKIRSLSYHVIKKIDLSKEQELLVDDNPLCYPPSDVCDSGLKNIVSFFQESQSEVKVYQGVKVLVVGPYRSGKTSFVQTLVDQQPRMSEEIQDTSGGIDSYEMAFDLEEEDVQEGRPGKALELCIWDFCGHPFYMYPHYVFFEQPTITVLTFNMAEYSNDKFEEQIGCWFDWMIAKTNKLVVILVGTQSDKLKKAQVTKVAREVRAKLAEHIEKQTEMTKNRIRAIEERPHISPTLSEQLKAYMKLLQAKFTVQTDVISTSAKNFTGFDRVRQAIESLAADRQLFPNVMRVIPTFWLDVQHYIEDRGNAMAIPVLKWDEFVEEVTSRFGMKHLMKSIAQYLHETGQVLWFSGVESLKDLVFIRPSWLFDVLRSLFRHDFEDANFVPDDKLRAAGLSAMKFERLKQEAVSEGFLDRDLLRCLLAPLIPGDLVTPATEVMQLLADGFELGYSITKRQRDSVYQLVPNKDAEGKIKLTKVLIPWLRKNSEPEDFTEMWESKEDNRKLVCYFKFPHYLPPGLFEIICVRAHKDKHKLRFRHHWGGGIHAVHAQESVHLLLTYFQTKEEEYGSKSVMLKYEIRDDSLDEAEWTPAAAMWTILLPLLMDFEELLASYAGILVERLTECPLCRKPSFLGEWLTPKETQGLVTRPCETCGQDVDTAFLVQPREKKRETEMPREASKIHQVDKRKSVSMDDILRDVMRKSRERRRGAAVTNQLSDISRMAPANPRRVAVAYPELDIQEGLIGLLGEARPSVVAEVGFLGVEREESVDSDDTPWSRRLMSVDIDVDEVRLLREIRKRSSQMTVDSDKSDDFIPNSSDFFVTHGDEDGDDRGNDEQDGGARIGLPGLAEFQRRMGIGRGRAREVTDDDDANADNKDDDTDEDVGDDYAVPGVPPG